MKKVTCIFRIISKDQVGLKAFMPYYSSDQEECNSFKLNHLSMVKVSQPRGIKHHRKFFALVNLFAENSDIDTETALEYIKLKTGLFYEIVFPDGSTMVKTKSIAFENMGQQKFQDFYEKAVVIVADVLNVTVEEIESNSVFQF